MSGETSPRGEDPEGRDPTRGGPVTVVVRRRVRPGHEAAYEDWLRHLVSGARGLPGFSGSELRREGAEYTSVFRYDSHEHLRAFEASELRRRALEEVAPHVEGDAIWQELTGLELWFSAPAGTVVPQPDRFRMALVMIVVVYGLVLSIGSVVGAVLGGAPTPVRLLLTITLEVFLMTYVIMPRLTRLLARWIYPSVAQRR